MAQQTMNREPFYYKPLSTKESFRLIRLAEKQHKKHLCFDISGHTFQDTQGPTPEDSDPHTCTVFHQAQKGKLKYTALSYHWGDPKPTRIIFLNRFETQVHENLWRFLRQLLHENDRNFYWTDALCINQCDNAERGHQVSYMDQIYSRAWKVVAWLSDKLMHEKCLLTLDQDGRAPWYFGKESRRISVNTAILEISGLEYWSRAWIVQEIALAQQASIKCGSISLSLDSFRRLSEPAREKGRTIPGFTDKHCDELLWRVSEYRNLKSEGLLGGLLPWLIGLRHLQCHDERDRIYSLLGLVKSWLGCSLGPWPLLQVNCSKTISTVIMDSFIMDSICIQSRQFLCPDPYRIQLTEDSLYSLFEVVRSYDAEFAMRSRIFISLRDAAVQLGELLLVYMDDTTVQDEYRFIASCILTTLLIGAATEAAVSSPISIDPFKLIYTSKALEIEERKKASLERPSSRYISFSRELELWCSRCRTSLHLKFDNERGEWVSGRCHHPHAHLRAYRNYTMSFGLNIASKASPVCSKTNSSQPQQVDSDYGTSPLASETSLHRENDHCKPLLVGTGSSMASMLNLGTLLDGFDAQFCETIPAKLTVMIVHISEYAAMLNY